MARRNGFSLVETLVAIVLASITVLALMEVVGRSSTIASRSLERFDLFQIAGIFALDASPSLHQRPLSATELLKQRYRIDHPAIIEHLDRHTLTIRYYPKEFIDPLLPPPSAGPMVPIGPMNRIGAQKIQIRYATGTKSYHTLSSEQR